MNSKLVTRKSSLKLNPRENITHFQLYSGCLSIFCKFKTYDFSEKKLKNLIKKTPSVSIKNDLYCVLNDYVNGKIAIAWKSGYPVYIKMIKEY